MSDLLAELFASKVRAAVLSYLLPRPHLGLSLTDLARRLDLPISSLQHECYKLERLGVLRGRRDGNARRYRVDPTCPVHAPLTALVLAALGPLPALAAALDGVSGLEVAFLTGVDAAATALPGTTPRLVLIGDVPLEALDAAVARVEVALGAAPGTVALVYFRTTDWRERLARGDRYALDLRAAGIDLLGRDR